MTKHFVFNRYILYDLQSKLMTNLNRKFNRYILNSL